MSKRLLEMAAEIACAQAAHTPMAAEEIERTLSKTYNSLRRLQEAENEGRSMKPEEITERASAAAPEAIDPMKSIQRSKVVCLECGAEFKQLTANHLRSHGLNPKEYKRKWGLPLKQPLAAKTLTNMRSKAAKQRGLPVKLQEYIDERRRSKPTEAAGSEAAVRSERPKTIRRRAAR